MQKPLILYGTKGCHLCEDAEQILRLLNLQYHYIDIIDDEKLLNNYQTSIPILAMMTSAGESTLQWPFDNYRLTIWMNECNQ